MRSVHWYLPDDANEADNMMEFMTNSVQRGNDEVLSGFESATFGIGRLLRPEVDHVICSVWKTAGVCTCLNEEGILHQLFEENSKLRYNRLKTASDVKNDLIMKLYGRNWQ